MNITSLGSAMMLAKDTAETMRVKARGTDLEKRLLEALSNENWGASSSLMNQLAQDTYDYDKYPIIMKQIWAATDNTAASWRKVFKALSLLEHLIKNGNERIIEDTRDHMRKVRMLTDFNFYEGAIDRGSGIREKSKNIIELLQDNDRIREERGKARQLREKFSGSVNPSSSGNYGGNGGGGNYGRDSYNGGGGGSYNGGGGGGFGETGSYSGGGIGSNSFDNRRGGEPPRKSYEGNGRTQGYSDSDTSSYSNSTPKSPGIGRYDDEPARPKTSSKPKKDVSNKKFDIKIKSAGQPSSTPAPSPPVAKAPEPEPDLFGLDTPGFATGQAAPAPPSDFDAFGTNPPVPPSNEGFTDFSSAPAQNDGFTSFDSAPTAFPATFDSAPQSQFGQPMGGQQFGQPMGGNQPMGGQQFGQPMGGNNQPMGGQQFGQPMGGQQFGQPMGGNIQPMGGQQFGQPMGGINQPMGGQQFGQPMSGNNQPMGGQQFGQPMGAQQVQQQAGNDFGDFQQVPAPQQSSQAPRKNDPTLSLVDLGGLSTNNGNKDKSKTTSSSTSDDPRSKFKSHDSFNGLDGFNTKPSNTMGAGSMSSMGGGQRPMGQPMGGGMGQPMGGAMNQPMGGQPMGQYNQPMGQPMGGQPMGQYNQMGGGMGMGGQPMSGMNQFQMGGMNQMGQPMGGQPMNQPQYQMGQGGMQQQWNR